MKTDQLEYCWLWWHHHQLLAQKTPTAKNNTTFSQPTPINLAALHPNGTPDRWALSVERRSLRHPCFVLVPLAPKKNCLVVPRKFWGNDPIWRAYFSKWVGSCWFNHQPEKTISRMTWPWYLRRFPMVEGSWIDGVPPAVLFFDL